jgi:transcriptional regulator with XRE-family HTH domain
MPSSEKLRMLRERRGYSQRRLASVSGLTQAHICNLERGYVLDPKMTTIRQLARALRVSASTVLRAIGAAA